MKKLPKTLIFLVLAVCVVLLSVPSSYALGPYTWPVGDWTNILDLIAKDLTAEYGTVFPYYFVWVTYPISGSGSRTIQVNLATSGTIISYDNNTVAVRVSMTGCIRYWNSIPTNSTNLSSFSFVSLGSSSNYSMGTSLSGLAYAFYTNFPVASGVNIPSNMWLSYEKEYLKTLNGGGGPTAEELRDILHDQTVEITISLKDAINAQTQAITDSIDKQTNDITSHLDDGYSAGVVPGLTGPGSKLEDMTDKIAQIQEVENMVSEQALEAADSMDAYFAMPLDFFTPAILFVNGLFSDIVSSLGEWLIIFLMPLIMGVAMLFIGMASRYRR